MLLTFGEVCDRLRMSPKTVRKLIVSGELEASKTSDAAKAQWRIDEDDLAGYLERRKVRPETAASS